MNYCNDTHMKYASVGNTCTRTCKLYNYKRLPHNNILLPININLLHLPTCTGTVTFYFRVTAK